MYILNSRGSFADWISGRCLGSFQCAAEVNVRRLKSFFEIGNPSHWAAHCRYFCWYIVAACNAVVSRHWWQRWCIQGQPDSSALSVHTTATFTLSSPASSCDITHLEMLVGSLLLNIRCVSIPVCCNNENFISLNRLQCLKLCYLFWEHLLAEKVVFISHLHASPSCISSQRLNVLPCFLPGEPRNKWGIIWQKKSNP